MSWAGAVLLWAAMGQLPAPRFDIFERAPILDVNATDFPAASLVDFGRAPTPVGACGRVFAGTDGRLYFEDGRRAVFWGINVAKDSIFQPREIIDRAVDAIAAAGFNLVRLHHFDDVNGVLPRERAGKKPRIDPEKLSCIDYWIKRLGDRGIYVYLDLNDYRTFWPEEGIADGPELGRGAKPYAVFVPRLIELQAQYAHELLCEHRNPLTGRAYAEDPAVLFIELCDENGLFREWKRGLALKDNYAAMLGKMFNDWLRKRYGNDAALRAAWTDASGRCCLGQNESLAGANVNLATEPGSSGRHTDTALFFADLHRRYFDALRESMRTGGVKELLIGGVAEPTIPADLRAAAEGLDFIGVNWYWDHPRFLPGQPWRMPYLYDNRSPMSAGELDDFPVTVGAARVAGKPLVVREWSPCWPNKYRAAAMVGAAVYGSLLDVDAMLLFAYRADAARRGLDLFDVSHDPARWGLAAACAAIFRGRLVPPARREVIIGYSPADVLLEPLRPMASQLHKLAYFCRVTNAFFEKELQASGDLTVSSGRSCGGKYPPSRAILFARQNFSDPYGRQTSEGIDAANGCVVATLPPVRATFRFGGTIFDAGVERQTDAPRPYFLPDILNNPDLRPIGVSQEAKAAIGVRNVKTRRLCFGPIPEEWAVRAALDALGYVTGDEAFSHKALDKDRLVAESGMVTTDRAENLLLVSAPKVLAAAGDLGGRAVRAGDLEVATDTPQGAVVWLSLDNKPLRESRRWLLKMASIAVNTGEEKQFEREAASHDLYRFTRAGGPPVLTEGHSRGRTAIRLAGRQVISLGLVNGTWELVREGANLYLWCDTRDVRFETELLPTRCEMSVLAADSGRVFAAAQSQPLQYPAEALAVRLGPVRD
ncbi:MAG: hypothetical protein N2512_07860 [Armatimonadetes bacterium]|nr:hypothetical protein [Armatimonadota bacterium]